MRQFHILTLDPSRDDLLSITDYSFEGNDLLSFWESSPIPHSVADSFHLSLDTEDDGITDAVGNPLSLHILSEKVLELWAPFFNNDVQLLKANLFFQDQPLPRFKILHCLRAIPCLDLKHSEISTSKAAGLTLLGKCTLLTHRIPPDAHNFRLAEETAGSTIVSDDMAQALVGQGINGIVFIRCESR